MGSPGPEGRRRDPKGGLMTQNPGHGARMARIVAALLAACFACAAAQAQETRLKARFSQALVDAEGEGHVEITFECAGAPTCIGRYAVASRATGCTNTLHRGGALTITNVDLTRSTFQGTVTAEKALWHDVLPPGGGVCTVKPNTDRDLVNAYTATFDGATGTITLPDVLVDDTDDTRFTLTGTFSGERSAPPPVFPMEVQSRIDEQTATASADIRFRPQDVGRNASVFVFAYAPAARVRGGSSLAKAEGDCVFAQVDGAGQLVAMSASQMSAFFSGVLGSQGQAVSILNNVSTPAVAGATFYVGYGSSGGAMLDEGVFRDAVVVPGAGVCPLLPTQTSLWWNPGESGWGLNLNHQGNTLFGTLFTYDAARAPLWLVMSGGHMQADGRSFTGELYRTTGPAFNAVPFTPITGANLTQVGTMTLSFVDANLAELTYTVNGASVKKTIQRQVFGARPSNCMPVGGTRATSTNYQDLWWNAAESGWGLNVTHQGNTLFATLFTYDASGRDLWLVMSAGQRQADGSYLGDLYRTAGPAFNAVPFTPIGVSDLTTVGTMRLRFTDGERGELTYTYNGATVTKQITRQVFGSPAFACN